MTNVDLSIVVIANKEDIYQDFINNLNTQTEISYELLTIDNYHNEFNSASKAYNSIIGKYNGRYLMFLHPDIRFLNPSVLKKIINYADELKDFGVIGVAGATFNEKKERIILSNIIHGYEKKYAGITIKEPTKVETLDECLFLIKREVFNIHPFTIRSSWHLYCVEYCLQELKSKRNVYVVPANIWHLSDGKSLDSSYIVSLKDLIKDYSNDFPVLYTTVKKWKTKGLLSSIYLNYYYFKQVIKKVY